MVLAAMLALAATPLQEGSGNPPPGFKLIHENFARDSTEGPDYEVSIRNNKLIVETRMQYVARKEKDSANYGKGLNPIFRIKLESMVVQWYGDDRGLAVDDGKLEDIDGGEFGGGILWYAKDNSRYKLISDKNTQIIAKTRHGIFAIQGLSHMMFWYSKLVEVERGPNGWRTRDITDLHEHVTAVLQEGDHFVIAMREHVSILETNGTQRELIHFDGQMYPRSIARTNGGVLWVGTTNHLLRLTPAKDGSYHRAWFVAKKP